MSAESSLRSAGARAAARGSMADARTWPAGQATAARAAKVQMSAPRNGGTSVTANTAVTAPMKSAPARGPSTPLLAPEPTT